MTLEEEIAYLVVRCKLNPDYWPQSRINRFVSMANGTHPDSATWYGTARWRALLDDPSLDKFAEYHAPRWRHEGYKPRG